jgi:hypothetical protein
MTTRRRLFALSIPVLALVLGLTGYRAAAADTLPTQLTDQEFWKLSSDFSEPDGFFRSDNLLSNEIWMQRVIPDLLANITSPSVYMGVGPEQNFTYIASLKPKMVFIVDVRRGNLDLQLMYKALFELSNDRADFVARLFSRNAPEGLARDASPREIFDAVSAGTPSEALYEQALKDIDRQLTGRHGFPLSAEDLQGIAHVFHAFYAFGPAINYASSEADGASAPPGGYRPTYTELMTATDTESRERSYLASEDAFAFVKALESKNLVVPIVGDFAGPRALRAVGAYLKSHAAIVSAFYVSNVEQYLRVERVWGSFCGNAARLPIDDASTFIRAGHGGRYARGGTALRHELTSMAVELDGCDRRP